MLALLLTMATGARATLKGSGTADSPYLISTSADWTEFCDNPSTYSSKYIKMAGFVTAAANKYFTGTFTGTFDGDGYTLTLNINGTGQKAPFMKIGAATIKNLRVAGNITATGNHSSGLVGHCTGGTTCYIQNCMVSATLTNTANLGGFIGHGSTATINMTDCVFNGTLNYSGANNNSSGAAKVGGFVSWEGDGTTTFNFSRCLFDGTTDCTAGFTPFIYKYSGTNVTGSDNATCLYTVAQSDGFPSGKTALDGTSAVGQTASEIVTTMSNANWEVENGRAWLSGLKTPYTISGIPDGWTVKTDGNDVDVISGVATIAAGANVVLTYTGPKYVSSMELSRKSSSVIELTDANKATAVSSFNSTTDSRILFTENINGGLTFTSSNGEIDMNGHTNSSGDFCIQNNVEGQSVTFKNGTLSASIDGAGGWNDVYNGTVILENMNVSSGSIYTDGHAYIINGGTYRKIQNYKKPGNPGTVTIYDGKFNIFNDADGNAQKLGGDNCKGGAYILYGGKYTFDPSTKTLGREGTITIPDGYSVQSNTDADSGTYPWVVKSASGVPANMCNLVGSPGDTEWTFTMPIYNVATAVQLDDFILTDGVNLSASVLTSYTGKACDVSYTRSFTIGKTSTVCLPFAYTKQEGDGSFYEFTGITKEGSDYWATLTEPSTSTLSANTPYLFNPATSSVTFTGTIASVPASFDECTTTNGDWKFVGTFATVEWTEAPTGIYGFSAQAVDDIKQGEFVKVGEYVRIRPMRCYLENKSFAGARGMNRAAADEPLPETIKVRLISANGDMTGIGSMSTKTGEVTMDSEAWYSIDGRRIEGKPSTKGIYVNNGKKVVIK